MGGIMKYSKLDGNTFILQSVLISLSHVDLKNNKHEEYASA